MPAELAEAIDDMIEGGEFAMAQDELIATLSKRDIAVTTEEREGLRAIMTYRHQPTERVDALSHIQSRPDTPFDQ